MSQEYTYDESEYGKFNEYDDEEYLGTDGEISSVEEDENKVIAVLAFISTWFIRIGMVLAVIVLLYYLFTAKFLTAFLFIIGLVVAYFFGYFLMFLLDNFISID